MIDLDALNASMRSEVPHNREIGLEVIRAEPERGLCWMRLPFAEHLVGDIDRGLLHGGPITTLLDAASGMAMLLRLGRDSGIATVDLRIDFLKPGLAGLDVIASTECYKLTRTIGFVRGLAYQDDEEAPIASVAATFIRRDAP
ncbi:MAG: PaaI family thioesterase [Sandaracinaceae bacterium]